MGNKLDAEKNETNKRYTSEISDVSLPTITSRCYDREYAESVKHGNN